MIVLQEAGQLGGLIGRSVQVGKLVSMALHVPTIWSVSLRKIRDAGYLFTVLSSEHGVRNSSHEKQPGPVIPHLEDRAAAVEIPWPQKNKRTKIGEPALEAQKFRDEAIEKEAQSPCMLVESAIDEAS